MPLPTTTTTTSVDVLRARGVAAHVAERLVRCATPDLIGAWCAHAEAVSRNGSVRNPAGLVVNGIRSGQAPPPRPASRGVSTSGQRDYLEQVKAWLARHVPECCDEEGPHPAALAAVIKLHHRYGKGSLTAKVHGAVIRAAVKAAEGDIGEGGGERGGDA